jgi:ABC-2 type transport system permease protein
VKALAIAGVNLRRLFREPANIFFVFVFPMLLILILGAAFGSGSAPKLGVVAVRTGPLGSQLVRTLDATKDLDVITFAGRDALFTAVERGTLQAGLLVPAGYDAALRAGRTVTVGYVSSPNDLARQLSETVGSAVARQNAVVRAARFARANADPASGAPSTDAAMTLAERLRTSVPAIRVAASTAGTSAFPPSSGRFDLSASTELLLFVFLTSMTGAVALIETRRLGVSRRMTSTPTSVRSILAGETLGRFGVAMVQGLFIMLGSALLFGVNWGQPIGAAAILIVFSLVGAGAGMLLGSIARTEQQAFPFGLLLGLGLGALGGCMVPLEVFTPAMRRIAHATPQAWANDAFSELLRHGGSIVTVGKYLAILLGYALVILALATWRLRRSLTV